MVTDEGELEAGEESGELRPLSLSSMFEIDVVLARVVLLFLLREGQDS